MNRNRFMRSALGILAAAVFSVSSVVQAEGNYVMGTATTGAPITRWALPFQL